MGNGKITSIYSLSIGKKKGLDGEKCSELKCLNNVQAFTARFLPMTRDFVYKSWHFYSMARIYIIWIYGSISRRTAAPYKSKLIITVLF